MDQFSPRPTGSQNDSSRTSLSGLQAGPRAGRLTQSSGDTPSFPRLPQQSGQSSVGSLLLSGTGAILWAIFHFSFCFLLQVCELFAPLLLIIGFGWACLPSLIGVVSKNVSTVSNDPQTKDLVSHITQSLPTKLEVMGHILTPHGLILDGFLLMAGAAFCATAATWLGRRL
ncbi:hypothetical protein PT277_07695 [Acetobacteraceae bacterium ESL0709]|nr:hypothetical protein [Acetobacteraceae bacterium ESL0697]MDF7678561.1 hypothetical protein [Acetobacteraceae bacterium ESL0709]